MLILFSLGSIELLTRQLKAVGGAVETMLFGCLLILLSAWLVLTYSKSTFHRDVRRRWMVYGCFGLAMGLGMWSHMLVLPFVAASLVFLVFFCYRELRLPVFVSFGVGFLLGFLPSLVFNIQHPAQNSLGALWQLHSSGGTATSIPFTLWDSIRGTVLVSLPMATGANPQCTVSDTPGVWRTHITSCMLTQGLWGAGFLLLYGIVLSLLIRSLVKYFVKQRGTTPSDDERRTMLLNAARLTLLASGGLTLLSYVMSPAPALVPLTSTRYLVGLLVMFPVLLAPLWDSAYNWSVGATFNAALFLFVYLHYIIGIIGVFAQVPTVQATKQQQDKMVNDLIAMHATHIYSDYWTCNRVIFQSNERIICSSLDEQLQPQENRYPPYETIVEHDAQAAYMFPTGSPQALAFARHLTQSSQSYERREIDGYVLFKPVK